MRIDPLTPLDRISVWFKLMLPKELKIFISPALAVWLSAEPSIFDLERLMVPTAARVIPPTSGLLEEPKSCFYIADD